MTFDNADWWLSFFGSIASIGGIYLSYLAWTEAKAAKLAASNAATLVRNINAIVDSSSLRVKCNQIIKDFDSKNYVAAKYNVMDVIDGVNQLKNQPNTKDILSPDTWGDITLELVNVRDLLMYINTDSANKEELQGCTSALSNLAETLSHISSKCQSTVGDTQL